MASYFNGTTFAEVKWKPGENCILIDWLKYGGDAKGPDLAMECDAEFCLDYNLTF